MSPGIGSASMMPAVTPDATSTGAAGASSAGPGVAGAAGTPPAQGSPPTTGAQGTSPPTQGAPPTDAFASVLSTQVARTALAEGQSKQTSTKGGRRNSTDADASGQSTADPKAGTAADSFVEYSYVNVRHPDSPFYMPGVGAL